MISHKHKFIFIHIPKAAGTTIEKVLFKYASPSSGTPDARRYKWYRNRELFKIIESHPDYYTFTFSRNPYSKIVSLYHFFKFHQSLSLKDFVGKVSKFISLNSENLYRELPYNATHLKVSPPNLKPINYLQNIPEYPFEDNGNIGYHILPQSYFIPSNINFIGEMESLPHDFNIVCDQLGIPAGPLPRANKTKHKHYTEYYNDETRRMVAETYAEDIEYFEYEFGE